MHSRARILIGRVASPRGTYGFVTPEDGACRDLRIPGRCMAGASHGDLVLARAIDTEARSGAVLTILERRSPFFLGVFQSNRAGGSVHPRDARLGEVMVPDSPDSQGTAAERVVEGPSVVWAERTAPGDSFRPAKGRVVEWLGPAEAPGVAEASVVRMYQLPTAFPPDVIRQVSAQPAVNPRELARRTHFTDLPVISIDPATARDHDDAVALERFEAGGESIYRLFVHIADVAHHVPVGTAVDLEARRRGTSVYFPGSSIPMLPEVLTADRCSLLPGRVRLVQTVILEFDERGRREGRRFADGSVSVSSSMTYEEVNSILRGDAQSHHAGMLRDMERLSGLLFERRRRRGSLNLDLPETQILVDDEGRPLDVRFVERGPARRIVEEFMLAANEAVAGYLCDQRLPGLYRVHENPDRESLEELEEALIDMGFDIDQNGAASDRITSLLNRFAGKPEYPAVAMMILRSLKVARYSERPGRHFGLAAPSYTHFTSPIRRYPDLVVHRLLRDARGEAGGTSRPPEQEGNDVLALLAMECSRLERRAEEAERTSDGWKKALYMKGRIGEKFRGAVTGRIPDGAFVMLDGLGVEGFMPIEGTTRPVRGTMTRRRGPADGVGRRHSGAQWRIGSRLRVKVESVDAFRGRILFRFVSAE